MLVPGGLDSASFAAAEDAQNIPCLRAPEKLSSRNRGRSTAPSTGDLQSLCRQPLAAPLVVIADVGS